MRNGWWSDQWGRGGGLTNGDVWWNDQWGMGGGLTIGKGMTV
jgi:hypothetical protein